MSGSDTTTFDGVEYEDKFTFLYVVPCEQSSIVGRQQALFEKPATGHARETACRVMGSNPTAAAKESHVADGSLRHHSLGVPQEDIGGTSDVWETETSARCRVVTAAGGLGSGEWRRRGGDPIEEQGDRVA